MSDTSSRLVLADILALPTPRARVIACAAAGMTQAQTARALGLTPSGVRSHARRGKIVFAVFPLYRRGGGPSARVEAASRAPVRAARSDPDRPFRVAALAFNIWREAERVGWDITIPQIAERLGESVNRVRRIAQDREWLTNFRSTVPQPSGAFGLVCATDEALEALGAAG